MTDKSKYDQVALFVSGNGGSNIKKVQVDFDFIITREADKETEAQITFYNITPNLREALIKVNNLTLFKGILNKEDAFRIESRELSSSFGVKFSGLPFYKEEAIAKALEGDNYIFTREESLSQYFNMKEDVSLTNDYIWNGSMSPKELLDETLQAEGISFPNAYSIVDGEVILGLSETKKLTKIMDISKGQQEGSLNVACLYNHDVYPLRVISVDGAEYVVTAVRNIHEHKNGFHQEIFCVRKDLL